MEGASLSGTLNDISSRRQADLALVQRECVLYRMRSGWNFPRVDPDMNSLTSAGDGSAWAANLTALPSSPLAVADMKGSEEETILIACTIVWTSTSVRGS